MSMQNDYAIHDLLSISIKSKDRDTREGYDHYLRPFKGKVGQGLEYHVRDFHDFRMPESHVAVGDFLKVENGVVFPSEHYALIYDERGIREYTTYANRATNLWIELLLLRLGSSFVHAAALELNGKGILFPAFGGVGKTTLISELRNLDHFKIFGDDYAILSRDGSLRSYLSDLSIYDIHLSLFPELKQSKYARYLFRRKIFSLFYWTKKAINFALRRLGFAKAPVLKGWSEPYVKVPASFVLNPERMGQKCPLSASILLERTDSSEFKIEKITPELQVERIQSILALEFVYGLPYLAALAATTSFRFEDYFRSQREILTEALSRVPCYRISVPAKMPIPHYLEQLKSFVSNLKL